MSGKFQGFTVRSKETSDADVLAAADDDTEEVIITRHLVVTTTYVRKLDTPNRRHWERKIEQPSTIDHFHGDMPCFIRH